MKRKRYKKSLFNSAHVVTQLIRDSTVSDQALKRKIKLLGFLTVCGINSDRNVFSLLQSAFIWRKSCKVCSWSLVRHNRQTVISS